MARKARQQPEDEPDEGISIRCVTTAERNGHTRREADACQIIDRNGGGSVGCPDCPYRPLPSAATRCAPIFLLRQ